MVGKTRPMKLLIDTKANRVLFAEAGKEVVDFIFSLLSLPLDSIVKVLGQDQMVGSIGCIYSSLEKLHIQPHQDKDIPLLSENIKAYYGCHNYVSKVCGVQCPSCCCKMQRVLQYVHPEPGNVKDLVTYSTHTEPGNVKDSSVTYIIMDDLSVMPMSIISCITLLNKLEVKNVDVLKEKNVSLGDGKCWKLLKALFESKNVLTDVFLTSKEQ
ncbi:Phosphoribosyltransferase-like protein [Dioscorea alata]|uniref:Phosphoribosyltransferase-like protein n=1 Tax=Dioscorea alata TaxID=55571 RepID=A0ACB7V353_DIOAL|nr:Phosphoribosyltransferase-like protein [Dioscorea alata]